MRRPLRLLRYRGVAPALCAALVLLAGARLVTLSIQQRAAAARSAAQAFANSAAQSLQRQLQALAAEARSRAALASNAGADANAGANVSANATVSASGNAAPPQLPPATRNSFWLTSTHAVWSVLPADRDNARDIAAQWSTSEAAAMAVQSGTDWLVALREPLALGGAGTQPAAWSVVYRDLGSLLVDAGLDRATRRGYDFALSLRDPGSQRLLPLAASRASALARPALAMIALPALAGARGSALGGALGGWSLAIRPRAGWFPATDLVVEASLVLLVAWLVTLGVADATRHFGHLRAALVTSRQRLQKTQQRLTEELEQRERLQRSFDHAHYHDSFTGLPNRRYFLDQVDRSLREQRTHPGREMAVLLIAVGRFKVVTDTLGHTAGDELMVQITRRVSHALSSHECVLARWADDALALMISGVHGAEAVLPLVHPLQQALQAPIELRRHHVIAAISIGATYVESGLQRAEEVLREADIALSVARAQGGSRLVSYSSSMQTNLLQLVSLEADLQLALERREFRLLFQPIVELGDRHIVGMEVLLRWLHPLEGLLRPARFLGSAEEAGLGVPIARWTIQHVCQLARHWRRRLPSGSEFYFSVNLSPTALLDPQLADYVAQTLEQCELPAAALKFELTESSLISNMGSARQALDRLHGLGVELMLDDFGTGYSSLSHLQLFPLDYIKIDGPLDDRGREANGADGVNGVNGANGAGRPAVGAERGTAALVRAMTQMAGALGLKTVAEVVESTTAVRNLQQLGCQFAQGNVFCAPVDADLAFQQLCAGILEPHDALAALEPLANDGDDDDDSATQILPVLPETVID